jgi:hypothetical protein
MSTRQRRRNAVAAAVLLLLLGLTVSGCEEEQPAEEARPTATERSPLTHSDVPPSGVEAQLNVRYPMGTRHSPCLGIFYTDPEPALRLFGCSTIPSFCTVCLLKFQPNQDVELHVLGPEGPVFEKVPVHPDSNGAAEWATLISPLWASGEYRVHAVQAGSLRASATFTIQEPTAPRILVLPQDGPPGQTFVVVMAGFQPDQRVPLHLYRNDAQKGWVYLTSLPPAQMDERGQNILYSVSTQPGDPEGDYLVLTVPESVGGNTFHVGN